LARPKVKKVKSCVITPHASSVNTPLEILMPMQVMSSILGYAVNDKAIIAMCGMGKVFVGELIEIGMN
jgi:hypothetical protein